MKKRKLSKIKLRKDDSNDFWTKIFKLADREGIEYNTFMQWRWRGYIPPSMHHAIVAQAVKAKMDGITHETLHKQWRSARMVR